MIDITDKPEGEFDSVLRSARIGEHIVYYRGASCSGPHRTAARNAYDRGLVALLQRRNGRADFTYIAQKLTPRRGK